MYFTISDRALRELIDELNADGYNIYGPVKGKGREYQRITDAHSIDLDIVGVAKITFKHILYPRKEVLYEYIFASNGNIRLIDHLNKLIEQRNIVIGLRACDLKAIKILDKVFIERCGDPYYKVRRENTILIGVQCTEIDEKCFCYYVNAGPEIKDNYDILLTKLSKDRYLVEACGSKGLYLVRSYRDYFDEASKEDLEKKKEVVSKVVSKFKGRGYFNIEDLIPRLKELFESDLWDKYAERCLACGRCNYICPTCHCFDIVDALYDDLTGGKRIRVWDSCHFIGFTRVTTGEVFRRKRGSRVRQRIYHKYYYSLFELGEVSCVGCGRCIDVCVAKIDIRDLLKGDGG